MKHYTLLEPEVPGTYRNKLIHSTRTIPESVKELLFVFDGWLGDDLVTSHPIFMVTDRLKSAVEDEKLTGVEFLKAVVTRSELFFEVHGNLELPKFWWMKISGVENKDDFVLTQNTDLIVSDQAYSVIRGFNMNDCQANRYP